MINFVLDRCREIKKETWVNYFLSSLFEMAADLLCYNQPEIWGAPSSKIYKPPLLPKRDDEEGKVRFFKGKRYLSLDPNFDPEEYEFRKPELEAG